MAGQVGDRGLSFSMATVGFKIHKEHIFSHRPLGRPRFDATEINVTIGDDFQHGEQDTWSIGWHTKGERGVGSARCGVVAED